MLFMSKGQDKAESIPLCIDVDGALLKTDLLFESFLKSTAWIKTP
jgi:hypothetical protein